MITSEKNETKPINKKIILLGFRTDIGFKKVMSITYLIFLALFLMFEVFSGNDRNVGMWDFIVSKIDSIITLLFFLSPYVVLSESPLRDKIPIFRVRSIGTTIIGLIILCIAFAGTKGIVSLFYTDEYKVNNVISEEKKSDEINPDSVDNLIDETMSEADIDESADDVITSDETTKATPTEPHVVTETADVQSETIEELTDITEPEQEVTVIEPEKETVDNGITVYITPSGKKYHYSSSCAGKNAIEKNLDNVKNSYGPCKKCT